MTENNRTSQPVNHSKRTLWLASAVLAAMPIVMTGSVFAQQRVGADGRVNDANNRVGSGGVNASRPIGGAVGSFGNAVVNGNIGAGKEFHGSAPSSDLQAFNSRTALPGAGIDNFTKNSAPIGVANQPAPPPNQGEAYYGLSRFTAPPPGFTQTPNTPGYVPAQVVMPKANDTRLGNVNVVDAPPANFYQKPVDLLVPGFDVGVQPGGAMSVSPLYGVRALNPGNAADQTFMNRFTNGRQENAADRLKLDPRQLDNAREELQVSSDRVNNSIGQPDAASLSRPLVQTLESPINRPLSEKPLNSALQSKTVGSDVSTDTGTHSRVLAAPTAQSTQYSELQKRLERFNVAHKDNTAIDSAKAYNDAMRLKREAEAKATNPTVPGAITDVTRPMKSTDTSKTTTEKVDPLKVPSLVTGVTAKGLAEMLKKAEDLMKTGKFTTAIDQYAAAEQVAPNQPLIWIGRANAELGASYYGRAEAHLKQAFTSDQALLMAQYDLRQFLGEDRLESVIKDLKEMASTNNTSPTPVFLLAYIAYNTGNERKASGYLDLADKRSGGHDPVYKLLRDHWALPAGEDAPNAKIPAPLNK